MPHRACEVCGQPYSERQRRRRGGAKHWAYRHVGQLGQVTWCHGGDLP